MSCRVCGGTTNQFLDMGRQPLSDAFRKPGDDSAEFWFDLRVVSCGRCETVQLAESPPADQMFHDAYPFRTSSSARMSQHFATTADRLVERAGRTDPFIVEFGSNDGTMLARLAQLGVRHLGIDPAANLVAEAVARNVVARAAWFAEATAVQVRAEFGSADVIYAANTLCHISDLDDVFAGVRALLAPDGVLVFEDPYLADILAKGSFDQIYDEHFYFFSATTVARLAQRHGFALVDVERLAVHGGELRYTLAQDGRTPSAAVRAQIDEESRAAIHCPTRLEAFAADVQRRRAELRGLLAEEARSGRRVAGYAATAKSATVLNYCGIGPELVPVVYDTTAEKQGRLTPGSAIPVQPFPARAADYPDTFLLFAWNHAAEIRAKESAFTGRGGRWIEYVPDVGVA